jgi:hypothetical protein
MSSPRPNPITPVNDAIRKLEARDRASAVAVLAAFKALRTPDLKPNEYADVIAAAEAALARLDARTDREKAEG